MHQLRYYQDAAIDETFNWFSAGKGNPLIVLPTGTGKSVCHAGFIERALTQYPRTRVLCLTHVRELIRQNAEALIRQWPPAPVGIYSSGLGRKDLNSQVLFAGIQSIHRRANDVPCPDIVMVDEAHLIPRKSATMYGAFLATLKKRNPYLKVIGYTATHYRLDSGFLYKGDGAIFDGVAYEYSIGNAIADGYLTEPIPKRMDTQLRNADMRMAGVKKQGGDFSPGDLNRAVDRDEITKAAVKETVEYGQSRKSWLIFASGVSHAEHIRDELSEYGISCAVVHGGTPVGERDQTIADFKAGKIRALCGAQIFTTGFDAPAIDLIADLNPTESTGLHVQKIGRGTRVHPAAYFDGYNDATNEQRREAIANSPKPNCLYLDFAGNAGRHGPLDALVVKDNGGGGGGGDAPVKTCPECEAIMHAAVSQCPYCDHEFPPPAPKIHASAKDDALLSSQIQPEWVKVTGADYFVHNKPGGIPTMRVEYHSGLMRYKEWIALEHTGYARQKACAWWQARADNPVPDTIVGAVKRQKEITCPTRIQVIRSGKFFEVKAYDFMPDMEE